MVSNEAERNHHCKIAYPVNGHYRSRSQKDGKLTFAADTIGHRNNCKSGLSQSVVSRNSDDTFQS